MLAGRHLQLMGVASGQFSTAEKQEACLQGAISDALDDQISLP
jgi:hypothetical protein